MTIHEATEIVVKAALASANGSANATEILEAAVIVRAYVREQEEN